MRKNEKSGTIPYGRLKQQALAGTIGVAILFGTQPAMAENDTGNDVGAGFLHTIQCIGLLLTAPERHLVECGVSDYEPGPLYEYYPPAPQEEPEGDNSSSQTEGGNETEGGNPTEGAA